MSEIQFTINKQIFHFDPNSIMHMWKGQTKDKHCFFESDGVQIFVKRFEVEPPGINFLSGIVDRQLPNLPEVYKWHYDNSKNKYYLFQEALAGADTLQKNINSDVVSINLPSLISSLYKGLRAIHTQGFWHTDLVFKNILIRPKDYAIIDIDSCRELSETIGGQNVIDTELSALLVEYKKQLNLKEKNISGDQYNLLQLVFIPLYLISYSKTLLLDHELKFNNYAPATAIKNIQLIIPNYLDIFLAINERTFSERTLSKLIENVSPYLYLNRYCIVTNWPEKIETHELGPKILNFYKNLDLLINIQEERTVHVNLTKDTKKKPVVNQNEINPSIKISPPKIFASILVNGKKNITIDEGDKVIISVSVNGIKDAVLEIENLKGLREKKIHKKEEIIEEKFNSNTRLTINLNGKKVRSSVKVRKKPNPVISKLTVNGRDLKRLYIEKGEKYLLTWMIDEAKGLEIDGREICNLTYLELTAPKKTIKHNIRAYNSFKGIKIYSQPIPLEVILKGVTSQQKVESISQKTTSDKKNRPKKFSKHRSNQYKKERDYKESRTAKLIYFDYTPKTIKKGESVNVKWKVNGVKNVTINNITKSAETRWIT